MLRRAGWFAATLAAGAMASGSPPPSACELFTPAEIAQALGVPTVLLDSLNSGKNEKARVDLCSWYVKEGSSDGVMVKLQRAASPEKAQVVALGARVDEGFSGSRPPEDVAGVGEEAQYLPYSDGKGGTLIVRQGSSVVTLIGSLSKAALTSLAKLAVPRL